MTPFGMIRFAILAAALVGAAAARPAPAPSPYFKITVVDEDTGRGVPLVELKTVNNLLFVTDSNGIVAFQEPGLMDQEVYFHVAGHGYERAKDFLGNRGVRLKPRAGGHAIVGLKRLNVAERLYRVTGQGIYRDSLLVGHPVPLRRPAINGLVMGQDTVVAVPYRGKIYWFWGDTERPSYPLGNFAASGATSQRPDRGGLSPDVGVDFEYFVDAQGFAKGMCPDLGPGLKWILGLFTVQERGRERLLALVTAMKDLEYAHEWHLAAFDDEERVFRSLVRWEVHDSHESAHPFRARVDGVEYFYLFADQRVRADLASLSRREAYEAFVPDGEGRYAWKAGARRQGGLSRFVDFATGEAIQASGGSITWNAFRRRWVAILQGTIGEVWFAEADTPVGPWLYARRVVSHERYNFYNPTQHAFFDQDGGRRIYFEGTYTESFSEAPAKTPLYDYNQIMYRLDLADPRLVLPAPVYRLRGGGYRMREALVRREDWEEIEEAPFFAVSPERSRPGLVPVVGDEGQTLFLALSANPARPANDLDGAWQTRARTAGGDDFSFEMRLTLRGEEVVGRVDAGQLEGRLRDRRVVLDLTTERGSYSLKGELEDGRLHGDWRSTDGSDGGTWSAERIDTTPEEERSPLVAPLYEYRRGDGARLYSTRADLPADGFTRAAQAVARVWRNPLPALILDRGVEPATSAAARSAGRAWETSSPRGTSASPPRRTRRAR
jgi:hypothetical protein